LDGNSKEYLITLFEGRNPMKNLLIILSIMLLVVAVPAAAQKVAFVNSATILRELPEAQKAQKELETQIGAWQSELERMGQQLQADLEDYQKKQALMDPTAKAAKERQITDLQQRARDFQAQKFDTQGGEAVQLREQKLQPIQQKVLDAIEVVAKEEGYEFILDKVSEATIVLYADPSYDLTYKVLDRLNRGKSTPAKK
jgi:outer membrane protein